MNQSIEKEALFSKSSIELKKFKFKRPYWQILLIGIYLLLIISYFALFFFYKDITQSFSEIVNIEYFPTLSKDNKHLILPWILSGVFFIITYIFLFNSKNRWFIIVGTFILLIIELLAIKSYVNFMLEINILLSILAFTYFILIIFSENTLYMLFHYVFKYRFFTVKNHDFFTQKKDLLNRVNKEKEKINVFFNITPITKNIESNLQAEFFKLIYFWYASTHSRVSMRLILPLFSIIVSIITFILVLFILERVDFENYNNFLKMGYVLIFLTILYLSMLYHINKFLNPNHYKKRVDKLFKEFRINFSNIEHSNKLMLYIDKNFLINIYDKKYSRQINLNSDKNFEKFILKGSMDLEGRNNVVTFYITFFILAFLTIYVAVFVESETDKFFKDKNCFSIITKCLKE